MKNQREITAQLERALEHHREGRLREAQAIYEGVLQITPNHPDALNLLGAIALDAGKHERAEGLIRRAIEIHPDAAAYHNNLGEALSALRRFDEAAAAYRQAAALDPQHAEAHNNLGIALSEQGKLDEGVAAFERAVAVQPRYAEAYYNLGNALDEAGRLADAVAAYRQALALVPDDAEMHSNLGIVLVELGEVAEALASFERALALRPDLGEARNNRGLALLLTGQYQEGWRDWRVRQMAVLRPTCPRWDGSEFPGKTLLVHTEQGFGDTLQFVRYLPMVKQRGGRVLLACDTELQRLLAGVASVDEIVGDPETLSLSDLSVDLHIPLLDLPGLFGTRLDTTPDHVPYLEADPALVRAWRERVDGQGYNVGLCWAGRPTPRNRKRSCALDAFAPLADIVGMTFYSLQKGPAAEQARRAPGGMMLMDHTAALTDFAETAALVANLDLVVSIDTAVVHLAGALGKPVWTLVPYAPAWVWLLDRKDSPWYPSVRLFRQPHPGDWESVMQQVARALAALVAA